MVIPREAPTEFIKSKWSNKKEKREGARAAYSQIKDRNVYNMLDIGVHCLGLRCTQLLCATLLRNRLCDMIGSPRIYFPPILQAVDIIEPPGWSGSEGLFKDKLVHVAGERVQGGVGKNAGTSGLKKSRA
jgi:hypothetical protein